MKSKRIDYRKFTILIIAIGIILRFALALNYTVAGDACWQFSAARFVAENKKLPLFENLGRQEPFWAPPLFHIMAAAMYLIFGNFGRYTAEFGMKVLTPILGSLTLIVIYLISKRLFNEKIIFFSMLFTTFLPIFIDYHVFGYIDGTLAFFSVLSIYFALEGKYISSSIAAGLASMSKYNGIFVLPVIIYIACKNTKQRTLLFKRIAFMLIIPLLMASPWLIRNYDNFGNPFWPFVNFLFKGKGTSSFESSDLQSFNIANIFNLNSITFTYLAIFGIPDGNYSNIYFFKISHIGILFGLWLLSTLFFIAPFTKSFASKNDNRKLLYVWICSYLVVLILYIGNAGWSSTRFFLPAIPALGMLYGLGFSNIRFKSKILKNLFYLAVFTIVIGFIVAESAKITLATREWGKYREDFNWIKENTPKEAKIGPGYQCLAYHLDRQTLNLNADNLKEADYIFVNQNFALERRSIISSEALDQVKKDKYQKIYDNPKTGTLVFIVR